MPRTLLISMLITGCIAGTWQVSHAETYTCDKTPNKSATCTVDDRAKGDNTIFFSCNPAEGSPPFEKSCSVINSPLPGYTWTGMLGYRWICGADMTVSGSEFEDKKSMCDQLCGNCDSGWQ